MKYSGTIKEYPGVIDGLLIEKGTLYFREGDRIIQLSNNVEEVIFQKNKLNTFNFNKMGLFIRYEDETEEYVNEHIDIAHSSKQFKSTIGVISDYHYHHEKFIFYKEDSSSDKEYLMVTDLDGNVLHRKEGDSFDFSIDDKYIYNKSFYGNVSCYDYNLNTVWEKENKDKRCDAKNVKAPYVYKNCIIVNLGSDKGTKQNGEVTAFKKDDGTIIWTKKFKGEASIKLVGDYLYAAQGGKMFVIEALTGQIIVNVPTGFEKHHIGDTLWTDGKTLFYVNFIEGIIRILSMDGKEIIQEMKIPEPYVPFERDFFVFHDGCYYLPLATSDMSLSGVVYGLLSLEHANYAVEPYIKIEQRSENKIIKIADNSDEEIYHVIVKDEEFSNVLRFGEIILKEYAQIKGSHIWSDERQNKKFNGKLIFSTNEEYFEGDTKNRLIEMIKSVEEFAEEMSICAGNQKEDIRVEIQPIPDNITF